MRTTLNIEDDLVERASKLTGIKEKTSLVRKGLETLISLESSKRLAALGGSEKKNPDAKAAKIGVIKNDSCRHKCLDQTFQRI
jgi:Arc/MetJ family transcription regulator